MPRLFRSMATVLLVGVALLPATLLADTRERLADAAEVVRDLLRIPEKGIPADLFNKADCVIVVPSLKKAAFGVGGEFGRGFAACRAGGGWSAPAGIRVEGGSFGFQIGGAATDVVLLVMNRKGMEKLLSSRFTLGGDASAAAGPIGRSTEAKTDALMTAEILGYSRSRGIYAGVSLEGSTLREDADANDAMYGRKIANREILSGSVKAPESAARFLAALAGH
jgi:lipid-binding SYLF domain-containing protein